MYTLFVLRSLIPGLPIKLFLSFQDYLPIRNLESRTIKSLEGCITFLTTNSNDIAPTSIQGVMDDEESTLEIVTVATFETIANGPWLSSSTWSGGNIPSNVIEGNDVVTIKHNVTYNVGDDLFVDKNGSIGTLEIIGGSLVFPNSSGDGFGKSVKIGSKGVLKMCNARLILPIVNSSGGNNSGNFENAGKVEIYNSEVDVAQNWSSTSGTRLFNGGCLRVGENFENNGSTDTYTNVCIEVGLHDTGSFTNISKITFSGASILIDLGASNFENNGGGEILGGTGAITQLRVGDIIKNDDTWDAEVLTYCFTNGISADNGGQLAANLTGPNDCPGLANAACDNCPGQTCLLAANCVVDQQPTCAGNGSVNSDGEISATISGGIGSCGAGTGITYNWEDNGGNQVSNMATATGLGPGTYFLTVTDAAGCTSTCSVTLVDPGCSSNPSINISKNAEGADVQQVTSGSNVTFTIRVENDGDVPLTNVMVSDPNAPACDMNIGNLAVGQVVTYTCTVNNVTSDFVNVANATGDDPNGDPTTDSDPSTVDVIAPSINISKNAEGADVQQVTSGSNVTFTIRVENDGDVPLTNVMVSDPNAPACDMNIGNLAVGQVVTYTCTVNNVTSDFVNVANATGDDPNGDPTTDSDPSTVDVIAPSINISKNAEGADVQQVTSGSNVTFTIRVENDGDVPLTNVMVSDPNAPGCDNTIGNLAVGQVVTYTCTVNNVTSDFINVANATGDDPNGDPTTDSDPSTVDVIAPSINISKNAEGADVQQVTSGSNVTFTIRVENDGDVPLTNVMVSDPNAPACDNTIGNLAVGQVVTYTCTVNNVTSDFVNVANATGDDPNGDPTTDSDPSTVDVIAPSINISKNAEGADVQQVTSGSNVTFTIRVENDGDVPLTNVMVSDPNAPACDNTIGNLAVGQVVTYTCTVNNVTSDFVNVANATGDDPNGDPTTDSDPSTVDVIAPSINISKNAEGADVQQVTSGSNVTFTIRVENDGDVPLTNVMVSDPNAPGCDNTIGNLAVGQVVTYTCTVNNVTSDFINVANATGDDPNGDPTTDSDPSTVDVIAPSINISKNAEGADVQQVTSGSNVTFTIRVENDGDVPLTNVMVSDPNAPACDMNIGNLAVGQVVTYTCTVNNVTSDFVNVANATGDDPNGDPTTDSDPSTVDVIAPSINISKNAEGADVQQVTSGSNVTFTIRVENDGDVPLTNVMVSDPNAPGCDNTIGNLAVGQVVTYTCTVNNVTSDFVNVAMAAGDDPNGDPVTDSDPSTVDVIHPSVDIRKNAEGPDVQQIMVGGTATFTIRVENTGDVTLTNVVVSDPNAPGCNMTFPTLTPGQVETYTCTVSNVTADFVNVVLVRGDDPNGDPVMDNDPSTVDVIDPSIEIQKTVYLGHDGGSSCPGVEQVSGVAGDDVTYCFKIINTGDTHLSVTQVVDTDLGVNIPVNMLLAPGDMTNVFYETTISGNLVNNASVSGNPTNPQGVDIPGINDVSDDDTAAVGTDCGTCSVNRTDGSGTVCPGSMQTFSANIDPNCVNPQYQWVVTGNGTLLSSPSSPTATVMAGSQCGVSYDVQLMVSCSGCSPSPITCSSATVDVNDTTKPSWNVNPPDITLTTSMGAACPNTPLVSLARDRNNPITTGTNTIAYSVHGATFFSPNAGVNDNCTSTQDLEVYVWNVQTNYNNSFDGCMRKIRVVFRLVDKCGNFRNRDIIYTIIDNSPPQLTNPAMDMNVQCNGSGNTAALNAWLASNGGAQASDNCQQVTWSNNYAGLSGSCPQTATVTFTASDGCGNSISTTASFTIVDNQPPVGICPQGVSGLANPSDAPAPDPVGVASNYSDACGSVGATLAYSYQGGNECVGFALYYIYNVFDDCGNTITCEVIHTGGNTIPLKGDCPSGLSNLGCLADVPAPDPAEVQANYSGFGPINVNLINTINDGNECSGFAVTYVYEVSDNCNASIICEVTHTGQDVKAPKGDCPVGLTGLTCPDQIPDPDITAVETGLWDDCGPVTVTLAQTIDNTGDCWVFSKTYIYHATDPCANLRICEVTHSGTYQTNSNVVQGPTDLTCIDQVPAPDADAFLANFSNGCLGAISATYFTTFTSNQGCNGFQVYHYYQMTWSCGTTFYAVHAFSGTNCPGCGTNSLQWEENGRAIPDLDLPFEFEEEVPELQMKIYPNPTKGEVNVILEGFDNAPVQLNIMNMNGAVIYTIEMDDYQGETATVNFNRLELPSGMYYISALSDKKVKIEKVVFTR